MSQKLMKKWVKQTARVPRGYLRFQVMTMLREKPRSGSEIADQIELETDGEYRPGSGSIYPVLKKLHTDGFTKKMPPEDGVQRYSLTDRGYSFFDENAEVMKEVRKRLDSVEVPFVNLFQNHPRFRNYFMRISKSMIAISEIPKEKWTKDFADRVETIVSRSADELEDILKSIHKGRM
ncbi:MAG: PadR family transcriptional regulator [Promethearchaeota archaeon]